MTYIISGVISDSDGKPLADAQIYFTESPMPLPDIAMLTDSDGKYSLSVPSAGKYGIGYNAAGFASKKVTVTIGSEQNTTLDVQLKK